MTRVGLQCHRGEKIVRNLEKCCSYMWRTSDIRGCNEQKCDTENMIMWQDVYNIGGGKLPGMDW